MLPEQSFRYSESFGPMSALFKIQQDFGMRQTRKHSLTTSFGSLDEFRIGFWKLDQHEPRTLANHKR